MTAATESSGELRKAPDSKGKVFGFPALSCAFLFFPVLMFVILGTTPRRVFTPNGDGVNDVFSVAFDNPADSVITSAKVFDLTGAEVSDMTAGPGDTLVWNGKDRGGEAVPGGLYIYRIEAESRSFTGLVAVAR